MGVKMHENSSNCPLTISVVSIYKLDLNKVYFKNRVHVSRSWGLNCRTSDGERTFTFFYFLPLIEQRLRTGDVEVCPSSFGFLTHSTIFFPINPLDSQS